MTLFNIKVQPFVKRAKGKWGPELHCLPRRIRVYRENYVPYAVSLIFVTATTIVVAAYGLFRYFHVKKADYTFYGQEQGGGAAGGGGGVTIPNEDHEMTYVAAPGETALEQESSNGSAAPTTEPAQKPAANPFRKDPNAGTNPFNQ